MNNLYGFDETSWEAFQEAAGDKYDYRQCSAGGGDTYGIPDSKKCRKGADMGPGKKEKESSSKGSSKASDSQPNMKSLKSEVKKLGNEYEKLRKDKSPKAEARKKEIMSEVNTNMKKQKELQTKLDKAAASQSPKAPRDSSPAGANRRSNAAMNARD